MRLLAGSVALLAYTIVGYPLAVAALGRLRPRPVSLGSSFTPTVSVVVAAVDEADTIDAKLTNLNELEYDPNDLEIVVVADGSRDDTAERARRHPRTTVLHDERRLGKAAAVNRGASVANGDVLVFTDANNLLSRDALHALLRPLSDRTVGCVTGRKAIRNTGRSLDATESVYWRYEAAIRRWESRVGSVTGVNGELLAVRREAFASLPANCVNDDFVLAMEAAIAGWRIAYADDATSIESASATTSGEGTRRERISAGRISALRHVGPRLLRRDPLLAWQVLSHKGLRLLMPAAVAGIAVGSGDLARRGGWARAPLGLLAAFLAAAAVGRRFEHSHGRLRALYAPYYLLRMTVATVEGWLTVMTRAPEQVSSWERVQRGP